LIGAMRRTISQRLQVWDAAETSLAHARGG
jgi:hypothetical protein